MERAMKPLKLITLLIILCSFLTATVQARKLLIVAEDWAPFEFENDNGDVMGIDVDIASYIFDKMGVDFVVRILPWKRAWKMMERGEADAVFSTSRKEKRMPYLNYPKENMWTSEYVFFVQTSKKQPRLNGYADAKRQNLRIGIINGNSYNEAFWETFPNVTERKTHLLLEGSTNADINFRKLSKGRIDLYIVDKTVGRYTVRRLGLQNNVTWYNQPLFSKGYPMPFAKKSKYPNLPQIAERFEQELIAMKKNGKYEEIREKWLQ